MRKFKALVILNLKAMLNTVRMGGKRSKLKAASGIGALVFMGFLGVYLSGVYSFLFASQFAPFGKVHLVLLMMGVLAVGMGLMFTLFAAQGIIFGGKDNDLMLSLPIPAFQLLLARTLALYVENLVFSLFVMIPAGVAYLWHGGSGGVGFYVALLVCTVFLSLVPTVLALVVGYVLAWVSAKFPKRALVSTLFYCVAFILLMVFMFQLNFSARVYAAEAVAGIESGFSVWGFLFVLMVDACRGNLLSFALFLALCIVPFLLVVWLFAGRYKKIVSGMGARSARSDFKLGAVAAVGSKRALLNKESKRFFGTPIYLFNTGFGLVMMVAGSGASLFFRDTIADTLRQMGDFAALLPMAPLLCIALAFMVVMTAITACSISLEGKQLWILKEAPVAVEDIFTAKMGFQLLLELPCLLVSVVMLTIGFGLSALDAGVILAANVILAVFCAAFGLYINLCMPKLDTANEAMVIKQSGAAFVSVLVPMLLLLPLGFLWVALSGPVGSTWAMLVCALPVAVAAGICLLLLYTKGKARWNNL